MSIFHNPIIAGSGGSSGSATPAQISRSLRLNPGDSAYISRTPAGAGNQKKFTLSLWLKRSNLSGTSGIQFIAAAGTAFATNDNLWFDSSSALRWVCAGGSLVTKAYYRDVTAWMHIVAVCDTANATASERLALYVNGNRITDLTTASYPTQNTNSYFNAANLHTIGRTPYDVYWLAACIADVYFIDGQALPASSFGGFDTNGIWNPYVYTGSYGTNGFHLEFADNSAATAAAIGKDTSGNGNNWTPNNISVAAGVGNDSVVDTPTAYGTDTGLGGEVRGNYPIANALNPASGVTVTNGGWDITISNAAGTWATAIATFAIPMTGKWYWEITVNTLSNYSNDASFGIASISDNFSGWYDVGYSGSGYGYEETGNKGRLGAYTAYGATYAAGDVIGVAYDADSGALVFYKNGVSQGTAFTADTQKQYYPAFSSGNVSNTSYSVNFGQRAFAYAAPSGYKTLCALNLPTPTITKGKTVMDVVKYTGNGSTQSITGLNFSPDLVWIKGRSGATDHALYDIVRGAQADLASNATAAETNQANGLTAFNSDGFSLGSLAKINTNAATYVAWAWDAGTSTVTNNAGSITSQVRANASAGISVVSWTGPSSGVSTVGHGLGVAPSMFITKVRNINPGNWIAYHSGFGATKYLVLNGTQGAGADSGYWNNTAPSSTVLTLGSWYASSTYNLIAYCFAPVNGFSAFGSYTGNGNANGPVVFTNLLPKFLLIKRTDTTGNWYIWDTVRNISNVVGEELYPNLANAAAAGTDLDVLSNGFKLRSSAADLNANNATYIYAAFAENPFSIARAR